MTRALQNTLSLMVLKVSVEDETGVSWGEKRGHEFKREQEEIYGKIWREERKGRNDLTML